MSDDKKQTPNEKPAVNNDDIRPATPVERPDSSIQKKQSEMSMATTVVPNDMSIQKKQSEMSLATTLGPNHKLRSARSDAAFSLSYDTDVESRPGTRVGPTAMRRTDSTASTIHDVATVEAQIPAVTDEKVNSEPVYVPRSQRRGLLAQLCLVGEIENARTYSRSTKWFLTAVTSAAALAAPVGSAILLPSLTVIGEAFGSSAIVTNLSVALYLLGLAIFPVWWSFFSEMFGRRSIYVVSFTLFCLWNVLTAISPNIAMLIVMRFLAGGASGSVQAVGAGTIADIWDPKERGVAMSIFYLGPLLGPLLSPIVGGALQEKWGWRSTVWFMVIYGGVLLVVLILALPETLPKRRNVVAEVSAEVEAATAGPIAPAKTHQSVAQRTRKVTRFLREAIIDPLLIVKYLRFPAVALSVIYASATFGSLYVLQISIQSTFGAAPYNFSPILVGCAYLSYSSGYFVSSYGGGRWSDYIMLRAARRANRVDEKGNLIVRPEDRMGENAIIAALTFPLAMLWYGWTARFYEPWPAVLVANFFFGLGSMIIFGLTTTMLTEFMPKKASSGVALNNLCRNIVACIGIFVSQPLIDAIGNGWLFTGLCVLTLASGSVIFFIRKFGPKWRIQMDEALRNEK